MAVTHGIIGGWNAPSCRAALLPLKIVRLLLEVLFEPYCNLQ